jgi:hypothetical protein
MRGGSYGVVAVGVGSVKARSLRKGSNLSAR